MKAYVRKQIKVYPIQFNGENFDEIIEFTKGKAVHESIKGGDENGNGHLQLYHKLTITTMHNGQKVTLKKGDWVMPESDGVNFYPCDEVVFRNTYDEVIE